jgi:hypothetical protein
VTIQLLFIISRYRNFGTEGPVNRSFHLARASDPLYGATVVAGRVFLDALSREMRIVTNTAFL